MKKKTEKIGRSGTPNEEENGITRTLKSEAEREREREREREGERERGREGVTWTPLPPVSFFFNQNSVDHDPACLITFCECFLKSR